mmetsp:Transcript_760/g.1168  ORF Transcript_760/g.1168 Transcript_760/m.1168 type:complete len:488 (+) Transcript_760:166-1629(+)
MNSSANETTPLNFSESDSNLLSSGYISNGTTEEDEEDQGSSSPNLLNHKGTIGMLGSISIAVNSLTGPAMLNLPSVFQKSGLIPTTLTIAFLCVLSTFCSLHMANVISKVPGNAHFHKEIEYSEAFRFFWGQKAFVITQIAFFACITCLNVASIIDTAQVVDQILSKFRGGAVAFEWQKYGGWEIIRWAAHNCSGERIKNGQCIPFEADTNNTAWMLTTGYILSGVLFLPMSLKDLKENAGFQVVGFVVLIVISIQFVASFLLNGIDFSNVSLWGTDWSDMFGVVLFNFAVVIAVPAWLYERKPTVNVSSALNNSSLIGFLLYIFVGGLGALTMPNVADNMLQSMMTGAFGPVTEICSMIFAFFIIGLGIPLFSVLTRLNLTGSGLCTEFQANALAVYLPWGSAWILYSGGKTTALLGWGGIFFMSIIVFLAPLFLSLQTINDSDEIGSVLIYGSFFKKKSEQILVLYILLIGSIASIILAIIGEFR